MNDYNTGGCLGVLATYDPTNTPRRRTAYLDRLKTVANKTIFHPHIRSATTDFLHGSTPRSLGSTPGPERLSQFIHSPLLP